MNITGVQDILHALSLPPLLALPLILIGLLLAFFGRVIFYYLLFMFGGIVIGGALAFGFYLTGHSQAEVFLIGLGGFFVGGLAAIFLFLTILFLIGAAIGFVAGYLAFSHNPYAAVILAVFGGVFLVVLFNVALPIVTAIQGGSLIGLCLTLSGLDYGASAVVSILVVIAGAAFQVFGPVRKMRQRGNNPQRKSRK